LANPPTAAARTAQTSVLLAWTFLTLACIFWAGSSVAGRVAVGHVPPFALSFWRWMIAFLLFLPFCAAPLYRKRAVLARHWKIVTLLAFLGIFGFSTPFYLGLKYTTAVNASLFNALSPIIIVLIAFAWLKTRVAPLPLFGVVLGFAGTVIIAIEGDWRILATLAFNPGDLLLLVAYVAWSFYTVILRWAPEELGHLEFTCALAGVGTLMFLPLYLTESDGLGFALTTNNLTVILYSAVFPSFLAYLFWGRGVAAIGMHQAGYSQYLVPAFGVGLAHVMLNEAIHPYHWAGIVAIFIGVWLSTRTGPDIAH